jgi:hypothetical protein
MLVSEGFARGVWRLLACKCVKVVRQTYELLKDHSKEESSRTFMGVLHSRGGREPLLSAKQWPTDSFKLFNFVRMLS